MQVLGDHWHRLYHAKIWKMQSDLVINQSFLKIWDADWLLVREFLCLINHVFLLFAWAFLPSSHICFRCFWLSSFILLKAFFFFDDRLHHWALSFYETNFRVVIIFWPYLLLLSAQSLVFAFFPIFSQQTFAHVFLLTLLPFDHGSSLLWLFVFLLFESILLLQTLLSGLLLGTRLYCWRRIAMLLLMILFPVSHDDLLGLTLRYVTDNVDLIEALCL